MPLNQERGHTHKERRVSKERKTGGKDMAILGNERTFHEDKEPETERER